jgi:suppressor of G2 allele of SKP1
MREKTNTNSKPSNIKIPEKKIIESVKVTNTSTKSNESKPTSVANISQTVEKTCQNETKTVVKKEAKNWDKIAKEMLDEEREEEDANSLFKTLYSSGDDDTKRAMMKSMYESKGTTLSMDWSKVGKKFVKPYD